MLTMSDSTKILVNSSDHCKWRRKHSMSAVNSLLFQMSVSFDGYQWVWMSAYFLSSLFAKEKLEKLWTSVSQSSSSISCDNGTIGCFGFLPTFITCFFPRPTFTAGAADLFRPCHLWSWVWSWWVRVENSNYPAEVSPPQSPPLTCLPTK